MFLAAGMVVRALGGGDGTRLATGPGSNDSAKPWDVPGIEPGDPPTTSDPFAGDAIAGSPLAGSPLVTLPSSVATVPLAGAGTGLSGGTTPTPGPGTPATPGQVFTERGVWVVKADGSSPILVARDATAGVAAGGTWVAFVQGGTVRAVKRSNLQAARDLGSGVGGTAAQGLPIAGGKRGVAFLQAGKVVLVDPAVPDQPLSYEAPGGDAVADEVDGEGRLAWADTNGLHIGSPKKVTTEDVQRGMLALGHGLLASLQADQVTVGGGPRLSWGVIDRLWTSPAGLVASSGGRVHLRAPTGEERLLLDRASTAVATATRLLYVSAGQGLATASLTGADATIIATAGPGHALTHLDLLDDATLVVTVS